MTASAFLSASSDDINPQTEVTFDSGRCVVWLRGEHDAFTAAAVSQALELALASDHREVVVDLSHVDFMGVAPVNVIMGTRERLLQGDRSLAVRSPSTRTLRVLDLCGFAPTITAS